MNCIDRSPALPEEVKVPKNTMYLDLIHSSSDVRGDVESNCLLLSEMDAGLTKLKQRVKVTCARLYDPESCTLNLSSLDHLGEDLGM